MVQCRLAGGGRLKACPTKEADLHALVGQAVPPAKCKLKACPTKEVDLHALVGQAVPPAKCKLKACHWNL